MKLKKIIPIVFLVGLVGAIFFLKNKDEASTVQETGIALSKSDAPDVSTISQRENLTISRSPIATSNISNDDTITEVAESNEVSVVDTSPTNLMLTMNLFTKRGLSANDSTKLGISGGSSGGSSGLAGGSSSSGGGGSFGSGGGGGGSSSFSGGGSSSASYANNNEVGASSDNSGFNGTTASSNGSGNQFGENNNSSDSNGSNPNSFPDNNDGSNDPSSQNPGDSNPDTPNNPGDPDNPGDPGNPNDPGNPGNPNDPGDPGDPGNSGDNYGGQDSNPDNSNPFIVSAPRSGPVGRVVILTLLGKKSYGDVKKVSFGNKETTFKVTTDKTITTVVPPYAEGGIIKVTLKNGQVLKSKLNFYVTIPLYYSVALSLPGLPFYYTIPYQNGFPPANLTPPVCYILPKAVPTSSKLIRIGPPGVYQVIPADWPSVSGTVLGYVFQNTQGRPDLIGLVYFHPYLKCYVFQ
ncbi:MAG: collagen-like protein [Verrucomicrobiia bacterium]